jgi:hypothetical protein
MIANSMRTVCDGAHRRMCAMTRAEGPPLQECEREAVIGRISLAQVFVFRIHGFPSAIEGFSERGRNRVHRCQCVRTVSTGTLLFLTTYSATLPSSKCAKPERPWVPMMIIWHFNSNAASTIAGRGEPSRTHVSASGISCFSPSMRCWACSRIRGSGSRPAVTQLVSAKLKMSMTCSGTNFAPNAAAKDWAHSKAVVA